MLSVLKHLGVKVCQQIQLYFESCRTVFYCNKNQTPPRKAFLFGFFFSHIDRSSSFHTSRPTRALRAGLPQRFESAPFVCLFRLLIRITRFAPPILCPSISISPCHPSLRFPPHPCSQQRSCLPSRCLTCPLSPSDQASPVAVELCSKQLFKAQL